MASPTTAAATSTYEEALAAVGSTGSINFMIVGFCMGVCSGFAIPVAQMFGAGDRKALCRYVGNGAVLADAHLVTAVRPAYLAV